MARSRSYPYRAPKPRPMNEPAVERKFSALSPIVHLSNNWLSLLGVMVVTTSTIFWLFLLPTTLKGGVHNPYNGILAFLVLPVFFFLGLILIPLGIFLRNRRERRAGLYPAS